MHMDVGSHTYHALCSGAEPKAMLHQHCVPDNKAVSLSSEVLLKIMNRHAHSSSRLSAGKTVVQGVVPELNKPGRYEAHCCAERQQQRTCLGLLPCDAVPKTPG